ncbi:MAG TPA: hypothetical protein PLB25_19465 [Rhodoferax sp.]|nr:hypothetical protein [Rhodoferax sp.]
MSHRTNRTNRTNPQAAAPSSFARHLWFGQTAKAAAATSAVLSAALLLGACATTPAPPDWQANAFAALNSYTAAYLAGNSRIAEFEFRRARAEVARTGRPDLVARVELVRCAAQVASLDFSACTGYQALAADALVAEQAYAQFLTGRWVGLQPELLPLQYRSLVQQWQASSARPAVSPAATAAVSVASSANGLAATGMSADSLRQMEDPLARLIAAGALLKAELLAPADIGLAAETASNQGWRRALLAWLGVQQQRALAAGDASTSASLQRRIDLLLQTP